MSQDYIKEKVLKNHSKAKTLEAMKISLEQMEKSICKIKCSEGGFGTGFFLKITNVNEWDSLPIKAIISNNHVLTEKDILPGKKINFSLYNDKHKLEIVIDESRKIYTSEKYDISIVELKQNDGIKMDSFLEIDGKIWKNNPIEIFKELSIYLLHYPKGIEAKMSDGVIQNIEENNYTIHHLCDSDSGSSGGPLISLDSFKVIGIHKGAPKKGNFNLGSLIKEPIEEFYNNEKSKKGNNEENKDKAQKLKISENKNNNADKNNIDKAIIDKKSVYQNNKDKNKNKTKILQDNFKELSEKKEIDYDNKSNIINKNKEKDQIELIISSPKNENKNNIIEGTMDVKLKNNLLFNPTPKDNFEIYVNNIKVNNNKFDFGKEGIFNFKIIFNKSISHINFLNCLNIISINLSNLDTSNLTNMAHMFDGCKNLEEIKGLDKLNTSKVNDMRCMFSLCEKLKYLDLTNFDTSNVINMSFMFNGCLKLKEIKGLNKFNTKKVTDMNQIFTRCFELENLDLTSFDTSNVTNMQDMFNQCRNIKEIKGLNKFNTSKVTNMGLMFQFCEKIESLDLTSFDTSNVKTMKWMFRECVKLKEIKGLNKFNTSKVTNMEEMFISCKELESLDLSNFDMSNVNKIDNLFKKCYKLKEIKGLDNLKFKEGIEISGIFNECLNAEKFMQIINKHKD